MTEVITATLDMDYSTRACRGEYYNGDVVITQTLDNGIFVCVVDASGHGRSAYVVVKAVEECILTSNKDNLPQLVQTLHEMVKRKFDRGAVILLGVIQLPSLEFSFIHIGDTHSKIFGPRKRTLVGQPGQLGHAIRTPNLQNETLAVGDTMVICSDGISERYNIADIPTHRTLPVKGLADQIIETFGKHHDDATCLVIKVV